jgi:hypothetical protein
VAAQIDDVLNNREEKLPKIGKYNAGQKLLFFVLIFCMCGLLLSGIVIWRAYFSFYFPDRDRALRRAAACLLRVRDHLRHHRAHLRRRLDQGLDRRHGARHRHLRLGAQAPSEVVRGADAQGRHRDKAGTDTAWSLF